MRFQINDVGHGFCAHLFHDNGNVMLWDCGHKTQPENRPSVFLPAIGIRHVHRFFVTNYDEDHISDLPNLLRTVQIHVLHRNESISALQLRALKLEGGPLSPAMEALISMIGRFGGGPPLSPPSFPGVEYEVFWCDYGEFVESNNISVVTFLYLKNEINVVIPGDIERQAWQKLLERPAFRVALGRVNVFVASHHGRENGYCPEVFDYCSPDVVVFSDSQKQYATQEMTNIYAARANGTTLNGNTRKVLTTRSDGSIWWDV